MLHKITQFLDSVDFQEKEGKPAKRQVGNRQGPGWQTQSLLPNGLTRETQKHLVATGSLWKVKGRIVKIIQVSAVGKLTHSGRTRIGKWDRRNISLVVTLLHMFTQQAKLGVKSIKNWQPSTQSPWRLN